MRFSADKQNCNLTTPDLTNRSKTSSYRRVQRFITLPAAKFCAVTPSLNLRLRSFGVIWCIKGTGESMTRMDNKAAFLLGYLDQDQRSKICLDHGVSKDPVNPWPQWIHRFLWHHDPDRSGITDPDPDHPRGDHPKGTQPKSTSCFGQNKRRVKNRVCALSRNEILNQKPCIG